MASRANCADVLAHQLNSSVLVGFVVLAFVAYLKLVGPLMMMDNYNVWLLDDSQIQSRDQLIYRVLAWIKSRQQPGNGKCDPHDLGC